MYSSITMETALAVALSTSANQQYRATVVPMCGSVMGAPAYLDISPGTFLCVCVCASSKW